MDIKKNLLDIYSKLPKSVKLVAVSKTHSKEAILEAYNCGQRCFGENKVQELCQKYENLPKDIHWHFIGHLQTNKVKNIAPFVELIHGCESLKLLQAINKEAVRCNRIINCLLQFHIAEEETKFGLSIEEAIEILENQEFKQLTNIRIRGVMGMATFTENQNQIRKEFKTLKSYFEKIKTKYFANDEYFCELSMGMSSDYQIAIEEGSTIIRVGSSIFGEREYSV